MNKKLFEKVKDLCKDTRLSEKYLQEITETLGDTVEDDSTDEEAIEKAANRIASVAKSSQGEATRWAQKAKEKKDDTDPKPNKGEGNGNSKKDPEPKDDQTAKELADLRKKLEDMMANQTKAERSKAISAAMEAHKIPKKFRDRLARSIGDDEDVEEAVVALKQDFITEGLLTDTTEGSKSASQKQVDEAAEDLLKSITAK